MRAGAAWHRATAVAAAALGAVLTLAGCQLFTATPFPGFLDKTDISIDLGSRIDAIAAGRGIASYDLEVVAASGQPTRILLLAEPPSTDPSTGLYDYTGQIIFMDQDLNVLGEVGTSKAGYFSKPYTYSVDPGADILAGYTVIGQSGTPIGTQPIGTPNGLAGFAFPDFVHGRTYLFAIPAGDYTSFDLSFLGYDNAWGIPSSGTLPIIPASDRPSTSDPNYANLGYQLVGLSYDAGSDNITFVLSHPSTGEIMATRMDRATAIAGLTPLLPTGMSWDVSVTVDRPAVSADSGGLFLVRRDGWMERYTWVSTGIPLATTGDPLQIVGDRSLSRQYAFLETGTAPSYMYRFDPSSRILTRYKKWW